MTIYTIITDELGSGAKLVPNESCASAKDALARVEARRERDHGRVRIFRGQREIDLATLTTAATAEAAETYVASRQ